jgi:hypothetical protein
VGALDQPRSPTGDDGLVGRARSSPWLLVAIVGGAIVILAWIGWAIYVTSDNGARAGLGVVIAWPAMLAALALISLPFIGFYLLLRHLSGSEQNGDAAETSEASEADGADADQEPDDDDGADAGEEPGDDADDGQEDEGEEDEGGSEEEEAEPETAAS